MRPCRKPALYLGFDTGMGPVTNAKVYKAQVLLLGSLLLIPNLSTSTQTLHASQLCGGGGLASTLEEDQVGSLNFRPRGDAPPIFYRALSRRSLGRYVLATSSLVGECARVYTPAPVGIIASSLCSRFCSGLDNRGRDSRGSLGKRKSSRFSYDKFMSQDKRTGDEEDDLCGDDGDPTATTAVPPDKYGRVSSAFLVRHEIGSDSAGTSEKLPEKEETDVDVRLPSPVLGGECSSKRSTPGVDRRHPSAHATTGSVFKSLGRLGRDKKRPVLDDMDLLSDSEDTDWSEEEARGVIFPSGKGSALDESPGEPDSVQATRKPIGRNLVEVDDAASTLVNKLRLGKSLGAESRGRNRRKTRKDREFNRGM